MRGFGNNERSKIMRGRVIMRRSKIEGNNEGVQNRGE